MQATLKDFHKWIKDHEHNGVNVIFSNHFPHNFGYTNSTYYDCNSVFSRWNGPFKFDKKSNEFHVELYVEYLKSIGFDNPLQEGR